MKTTASNHIVRSSLHIATGLNQEGLGRYRQHDHYLCSDGDLRFMGGLRLQEAARTLYPRSLYPGIIKSHH